MADYEDVKKAVMQALEDNLTDPDPDRRALGKKWIYDDLPRPDITTYPRIGIESPSASNEWAAIGGEQYRKNIGILVAVYVDKKRKLDLNDDGTPERAHEILSYLVGQVKAILLRKANIQTYFQPLGVYAVVPRQETFAENDDILLRQVYFDFMLKEVL